MGIARLWLLVAGMLWVMCWCGHKANGQYVGLYLNGVGYPNNSIVSMTDIGTGSAALFCTTTRPGCCTSVAHPETQWYFPNGSQIPNNPNLPYQRTRSSYYYGSVRLNRNFEDTTTTGIFHCDIPDARNVTQSLYVGIYSGTAGTPTASTLVYDETTRSFTCTSTGGPATTVTWRKNGVVITLNTAYQQTQVVTDAVTGTYETVLTIAQSVTDIFGTYNCTVGNSRGTSTVAITNPTIQMELISNTTRLPNTAPYNTFFLTCTASVPQGVISPKTFRWIMGASTSNLNEITDNGDSILITSTNLNQPTSTSVLTVRETTAGDYRYRCWADLTELSIAENADVYPVTVTGPTSPVQPQNLMNTSTFHNRATVQWSVSYIAYTSETYTVNYGRAMDSLNMSATATQRGDNFTIPNQPFTFSAELTGLAPGVRYYYQVEARNSVRSTLSAVQQFTSNELPPTPPQMFQITAATTNSLSFSWQEPADPNGVVTRYELSCLPLLLGISMPQPLSRGRTDRMTVLANLHPGVRYNCSIAASNGAGQSNRVYADGTTQETAPDGPPQSYIVIASTSARNVTFSWSPPVPSLRNGIITGYSLSCVPEGVEESTVSMPYTQSGTFTLEGFAPATIYNCSISASNSEGSGPVAYTMVTTRDDTMLFQLRLSGLPNCQEWVGVATSAKLNDVTNAVVQNTEQLCRCGFRAEHITEDAFQCFANSEQQVTFRARLHGTAQTTSSQLLINAETWVAEGDSTIAVQGIRLHVDSSCLLAISTFGDPECATEIPSVISQPTTNSEDVASTEPTTESQLVNGTGAIVGGVVSVLIVTILAVTIIVIAVLVIKNHKSGFSLDQDIGKEPAKSSGTDIITKHEMSDMFGARLQPQEYNISTTPCPAYVYTSPQESGRVEEPMYESIDSTQ